LHDEINFHKTEDFKRKEENESCLPHQVGSAGRSYRKSITSAQEDSL